MAAGRYSFVIEQGATTDFEVVYQDSGSNPISLADHQARMQIRSTQDVTGTLILTLSSSLAADGTGLNLSGSNGTTHIESGSIGVKISAHSSSLLDFTEAFYDLEISSGSSHPVVTRILEGKVQLSKNVTSGSF
tara:strand:+ start:194 stop:595 length:402 start_codon:yes stop_codon:yes gene_type:complete